MITVSIVSHSHGSMVAHLVDQLLFFPEIEKIVITLNVPEASSFPPSDKILVLRNPAPIGFGANHNIAFRHCSTEYFCVLNPDIAFTENPFDTLLAAIKLGGAALVAPLIVTPDGRIEDSIRKFPTIAGLAKKMVGLGDGRYVTEPGHADIQPDWVGGMFMLFRSNDFAVIGGFDEAYFLYYEDVDICTRLWLSGRSVIGCLTAVVIHDAQRASHKSWRFFRWHVQSASRYLLRYSWRHPR